MRLRVNFKGGHRLKQLPGVLERARGRAVRAMATRYVEDIHDWIDSGRSFDARNPENTGSLQQSINWQATGPASARVFADAEHAPFVELGTRPHIIRPRPGRKALRFQSGGQTVLAKSVQHPGTKPLPFFFADQSNRRRSMLQAAREAVAFELGQL